MFDKKLVKYKNIIGLAYEVRIREDFRYYANIYTYFVIYKNGVKFVKNKKIECITDTVYKQKVVDLTSNGYDTVQRWIEEIKKNLLDTKVLRKEYKGDNNEENNNN